MSAVSEWAPLGPSRWQGRVPSSGQPGQTLSHTHLPGGASAIGIIPGFEQLRPGGLSRDREQTRCWHGSPSGIPPGRAVATSAAGTWSPQRAGLHSGACCPLTGCGTATRASLREGGVRLAREPGRQAVDVTRPGGFLVAAEKGVVTAQLVKGGAGPRSTGRSVHGLLLGVSRKRRTQAPSSFPRAFFCLAK